MGPFLNAAGAAPRPSRIFAIRPLQSCLMWFCSKVFNPKLFPERSPNVKIKPVQSIGVRHRAKSSPTETLTLTQKRGKEIKQLSKDQRTMLTPWHSAQNGVLNVSF